MLSRFSEGFSMLHFNDLVKVIQEHRVLHFENYKLQDGCYDIP